NTFHVACEMRFRASEGKTRISFREDSSETVVGMVTLLVLPDGSWTLERRFFDRLALVWKPALLLASSHQVTKPVLLPNDQWHDLSLQAWGNDIQIFAAGCELIHVRDSLGRPEFRSTGDAISIAQEPFETPSKHPARLELDFLRIWKLDEPPLVT